MIALSAKRSANGWRSRPGDRGTNKAGIRGQVRHRLLDDAPSHTNAANQAPITVNLSVLLANRVAQIHAPPKPEPLRKKIPKVVTTAPNQPFAQPKLLIRLTPLPVETGKPTSNCSSSVRLRLTVSP